MNTPVPPRRGGWREKVVWVVLVGGLVAVTAIALATALRPRTPGPERLGPAPEFTLTTQRGTTLSRADLQGTVWVADFMFTRCQGICPILTQRMGTVQTALEGTEGWKLVSFSVDPEYDTPEVLTAYAAEHGADPDRWVFLTGDRSVIYPLITDGFHLAVEDSTGNPENPDEPVLHSSRFVLVDGTGEIRGYYDALDQASVDRLTGDVKRLVRSGGA